MKTTNKLLLILLGVVLFGTAVAVRTVGVRATTETVVISTETLRESGSSALFRAFCVLVSPLPSRLSR